MSYHIYTTEGIVLKKTSTGESDVYLHILTKDLGLIIANAKSVRVMQSKLRSALVEYNLVTISCIKGKNGWKLTNAVFIKSYFYQINKKSQKVLSQISNVLLKMIAGESPNKNIFDLVESSFNYLEGMDESKITDYESIVVLRLLYELGYIEKNDNNKNILEDIYSFNDEVFKATIENKKNIITSINKAFKESHL